MTLDLFDKHATPPSVLAQEAELARVSDNIREHVLDFCEQMLAEGKEWSRADMWKFVNERRQCEPDSPRRILFELATPDDDGRAVVKYRQVDDKKGVFRILDVERSYAN